ncbi:MAG: hypothetical protein ACK4TA_06240 [Saprospiraceae bacterium]
MSLIRSLLIYGWIVLIAAYSAKQVIDISLIIKVKSTTDTPTLFAHDDTSLSLPNKPAATNLPDVVTKSFIKLCNYNNRKIIITANYYHNQFIFYHPTHWAIYISKIIYPFHYFW